MAYEIWMYFEIIGEIENVESVAVGTSIRDLTRLRKRYGAVRRAELHWYEAHGIGKVKFKIKQFLD